jgi:uncharacterized protein with HEPN domain
LTANDERFLTYIRESIARVHEYARGGRESFLHEPMVQDAILRRLETVADAAGRLTPDLKARHPDTRWRAITGFRNIAAHAYMDVQADLVWEIIQEHLPALASVVDEELGADK